ncbi:MAG: hypothetical protein NWQ28_02095 [Nodularia sp. (in: cyanobacteria)]|nr:hypothetical protein [Nodularia sp. (in: cyanobacteria)]
MPEGKRFLFTDKTDSFGQVSTMPYLPLILSNGNKSLEAMALLDTGASVNVLPYQIGLQLGAVWEEQTVKLTLSGNLANNEARGLVVSGKIANFSPILLAFAWTQSIDAPIILGHINFFAEFNVCFYRHELAFEVFPR